MARPLLVFIGSPNVGSYINVMANSVSKHDVDSIALIRLLESPSGEQVNFENFANKDLWDTLSGLVEGIYKWRDQEGKDREALVPEAKECEAYKKLKNVFGNDHFLRSVNYQ